MSEQKNERRTTYAGHEEALKNCSLFSGLSLEDVRHHCPSALVKTFSRGDTIYSQGSNCAFLFCILKGQVKLARGDSEGNEFTTDFLSTCELFGPVLGNSEASEALETAIAKDVVAVWQVCAEEFRTLLAHTPTLSMRVIDALGKRQRKMERRLECFAFKRIEVRLAETLRELSGGFNTRCEHGYGMHIRLTQQELADLVGASRPVVSSILNKLRKTGILNYNRDYLCVRGIEEIEELIGK